MEIQSIAIGREDFATKVKLTIEEINSRSHAESLVRILCLVRACESRDDSGVLKGWESCILPALKARAAERVITSQSQVCLSQFIAAGILPSDFVMVSDKK